LFDEDYQLQDAGFVRVPATARMSGTTPSYQLMQFAEGITVKKAGFLYIYLSNESEKITDVHFDDFSIEHKQSPVLQEDHYFPFGMQMNLLGFQRMVSKENKYLYNGKERQTDFDLDWYDYGARMYDAQIGRFHVQDRYSEKYLDFSPYQYAANNSISNIDINGDSIINLSRTEINALVKDLNLIYKEQYGKEGFSVHERTKSKQVRTNDWSFMDPSTWGNILEKAEYKTVTTTDYAIAANEDFDWSTDKYTSAMKDLISSPGSVYVDIVADNGEEFVRAVPNGMKDSGLLKGFGGGFTESSRSVLLSDRLPATTNNNKSNTWTLGSVALHELLYHIHPQGLRERNPNKMRNYYNIKTGKPHPAGDNQKPGLK
jgi:RHS repeat-associated protein